MVEKTDAGTLRVDAGALQKFAKNLGDEADGVKKLNAGDGFGIAANALPGTQFGTAVPPVTDAVNRSLARIGERLEKIASLTHNAAGAFEVAETDFANNLKTIGLQLP
ncbi:type VII secretion target [Nocardia pseudovaccinii]|uniref:type VII secretion target n=1 Tax=Nocardia pseudovaccinii TaxID=189540 RepID=UPI0007A3F8EE|nr:type VII secretion target [Nocardia pseudovaccinii]